MADLREIYWVNRIMAAFHERPGPWAFEVLPGWTINVEEHAARGEHVRVLVAAEVAATFRDAARLVV